MGRVESAETVAVEAGWEEQPAVSDGHLHGASSIVGFLGHFQLFCFQQNKHMAEVPFLLVD
jgi:hypothetical protein